jgi:thiosulfate/3-mercaptopyruvate sulfurtransferase
MSAPFITAASLGEELAGPNPPVVIDASFILHTPQFDGDYRRENARSGWLEHRIPGSIYVDVSTQFSDTSSPLHYTHPTPQAIADELARLGISEHRAVVVYDTTGTVWAARLWYLLGWIGVNVRVLDGGLAAWTALGLPTESGPADVPVPVTPWIAREVRPAWVTQHELLERAANDERALVCGLPAASFTGTAPTRYSRRGRIPNSVNVSSRDLFGPDGTVLADADIADAYRAVGVGLGVGDPEVLLYCGGGISASASALTLAAIGAPAVRIYDGSLEEWSSNPELPLEVGQPAHR